MKKGLLQTVVNSGIDEPREYFDTLKYTGHQVYSYQTSPINKSNFSFQPDLVILGDKDYSHISFTHDIIRGAGERFRLGDASNGQDSNRGFYSFNVYGNLTAFISNGFTLSKGSSSGYGWSEVSKSPQVYFAYCFYAGNATSSDSTQDITATIAAAPEAGISVINYTGNGTTNQTIPHGLDSAPEMIIIRGSGSQGLTFLPLTNSYFNHEGSTVSEVDSDMATKFGNGTSYVAPTSSNFTVGNDSRTNNSSREYAAYAFTSIDGYQKFGTYNGTGTSGLSITTGFQPHFVGIQRLDSAAAMNFFDANNSGGNAYTFKHTTGGIATSNVSFTSTGFDLDTTNTTVNASSGEYFYWAIA